MMHVASSSRPLPLAAKHHMYLRVKICGVTTPEDAAAVSAAGADAIGLNFYPPSPRCIDAQKAEAILRALPPFVETVGVFVNPARASVEALIEHLGRVRVVQCHGHFKEMSDTVAYRVLPAFSVRDADSLNDIAHYVQSMRDQGQPPFALLSDAHVAGEFGGTGKTAPWELLADFRPGVPIILAGGLTPDNVADAVRIVRPYGVDVASGVESAPGRKDPEKVRRFIANARHAALKAEP
jgi:phosphoribosylanthranilate isomerase